MPVLNLSELNIVLSVLGAFTVLYGIISVKIKQAWYLGEALPAVFFGVLLGPLAAKFIESEKWGSAIPGQTNAITLGVARVMIGVQLVIAGYQLPAKYNLTRWKEMALCLLPIMTVMWLCTTACIMLTIPKVTLLAALVIGSCVTCTDPILSQAIAKGPFADKYVARPLREIISSEAGANDGFGFPFLMLATYLIQHADVAAAGDGAEAGRSAAHALMARAGEVGRLGGGPMEALKQWFIETWLYTIVLSIAYGVVVGYGSCKGIRLALKWKWIDNESYVLFPTALGLFIVGTCGALGTDDLLACFVAGSTLNWDGHYLHETEIRHDEVNSCVDVLLNFGGFMYIGAILPWSDFNDPTGTGITWSRLLVLGLLVLIFRRLPAIFAFYKLMPDVCTSWKEALFMGYFGPIGAGAVFYVEHARHLFPHDGEGDEEETNLVRAMGPTVYWLVLFSIIVHGLSIPALNIFYHYTGKAPIKDDAVELRRISMRVAPPANAVAGDGDNFIAYNRFSRHLGANVASLPIGRSTTEDQGFSDDEDLGKGRPSQGKKGGLTWV
ncbi:Na-H-Exchanger domain-containing protein [Fusarium keratoplasticum]|uniref:Na-H-Exchanger domain-containing protein n=1 Tax=Fusarium keratoplasticum TaxID=1328300 RepID=A0ACC0R252_9HYPO|nr:Na-H-Exchanger domain-containing protein [Fusarium keratoplasticum]KAI8674395.1 Na-H-Exchanger domain-containing protein [Fusarium keratoplasticum]